MATYRFFFFAAILASVLAWFFSAYCVVGALGGLIVPENMFGGINPEAVSLLLR